MAKPVTSGYTLQDPELAASGLLDIIDRQIDIAKSILEKNQPDVQTYGKARQIFQNCRQDLESVSTSWPNTEAYKSRRADCENKLNQLDSKLVTLNSAGVTVSNETFTNKISLTTPKDLARELSAFQLFATYNNKIDEDIWRLEASQNKPEAADVYAKVQRTHQNVLSDIKLIRNDWSQTEAWGSQHPHLEKKLKYLGEKLVTLKPAGYTVPKEIFTAGVRPIPGLSPIRLGQPSPNEASTSSSGNGNSNIPPVFAPPQSPPPSSSVPLNTPSPTPVNNNTQLLGSNTQLFNSNASPSPIPQNTGGKTQVNTQMPSPLSFSSSSTSSVQGPKKIENATGPLTAELSNVQILECASYFFRNGNGPGALEELKSLPKYIKGEIQEALWIIRGRPQGHHDYGDASLWDKDPACASTLHQKGAAVEAAKIPVALRDIIYAYSQGNEAYAKEIIDTFPSQILKDFLEKQHNIPAYLTDYKKQAGGLLDKIVSKQGEWKGIDQSQIPGSQKNDAKKETLHQLAKEIVPQFMLKENVDRLSPRGNDSYHSLAVAYINRYPCLRPFFLTLFLNEGGKGPLQLSDEKLPEYNMRIKTKLALMRGENRKS